MHLIVLLLTLLNRAGAPSVNISEPPTSIQPQLINNNIKINTIGSTMATPVILINKNINKLATPKPRRKIKPMKSDSPMLNYIFDSYATSNKHFHDKFRAPSFEGGLNSEDTILDSDSGATVYLDCKVNSLRDKMVSWLRVSDDDNLELLTLDLDTHTADSRYRVDLAGDNWRLELANVKAQDSGIYCCHVSTHPPMLRRVQLTVHPPEIMMSKEAFLETGETLSLKCTIFHLHPGESAPLIHWFRGNTTLPLDEVRGGVLIETDHLTMTSNLQVAHLKMEDAGNYTCVLRTPIEMRASTRVHVLQGSSLAELQSGVKISSAYSGLLIVSILLVLRQAMDYEMETSPR